MSEMFQTFHLCVLQILKKKKEKKEKGNQIWRSYIIFSCLLFCYVANYDKIISLKQKAFTISHFYTS